MYDYITVAMNFKIRLCAVVQALLSMHCFTFSSQTVSKQDGGNSGEAEANAAKDKPTRLRSLDTFRGYVHHQQQYCLSVYHHMRLVHMLILFSASLRHDEDLQAPA